MPATGDGIWVRALVLALRCGEALGCVGHLGTVALHGKAQSFNFAGSVSLPFRYLKPLSM